MTKELKWIFPERHPQDFQEGSDGNQKAFDGSIDSVLREAIQNSSDAKWPMYGDSKVKIRVTAIKLTGTQKNKYLKTMGWQRLEKHLKAVIKTATTGANLLPQSIKEGHKKITSGPLYLLKVEDFNTSGLFGYEEENPQDDSPNAFRAVHFAAGHSVNKLVGSGGSFGMGKYALMKGSLIQTVLYNSNINREKGPFLPKGKDVSLDSFSDGKYKNRFLGRTVLGTHEIDGTKYTKEGWYGSPHEVQTKNSAGYTNRDTIAKSEWTEDSFVKDLYLERNNEPGTSVMIVGFDPEKEFDNYDVEISEIVEEMKRKIALNFWPAMSKKESMYGGIQIEVGGIENGNIKEEFEVLDPKNYVQSHYLLYKLYEDSLQNPVSDLNQKEELKSPKDTAARVVHVNIPKTKSDLPERYKHDKAEHDVALLVKYVDPTKDGLVSEDLLNKIALIRGPGMVVKYEFGKDSSRYRGKVKNFNKDFIAIACVGAFAQDPFVEIDAQIADKYFTHCEPPHHDQWTHETDAFEAIYSSRGPKKEFNENMDRIRDAVSELLREDFQVTSDIPLEMQMMLTFPGEGKGLGENERETKKFRIKIEEKNIEFSEKNGTYKIPVSLIAPKTISKDMSIKVGVSGDSVKATERKTMPFQIPKESLKGKGAKLISDNVIRISHNELNAKKEVKYSYVVKTSEVGTDPFSLGISIDDPVVLEVH